MIDLPIPPLMMMRKKKMLS